MYIHYSYITFILIAEISTVATLILPKQIFFFQSSPTVFSAGLDILEMYKPDPEKVKLFWTTLQGMWLQLYGSAYPTAAAINVRICSE